jgi:hypothetical protein
MHAKFFGLESLAPNIKMSLVMFLAQVSINTYNFSTASQIYKTLVLFFPARSHSKKCLFLIIEIAIDNVEHIERKVRCRFWKIILIIRARILGKMDYFYFLRHMYETCL